MAVFKDEAEVYEYIGKLFLNLRDDPVLGPQLRRANTIAQFRNFNPESQITVAMCEQQELRVDFGPTDLEPEIEMLMDADIAHRFWLGRINATVALARGQMKFTGPVAKILKLVPLVKPVFPRYRAQLDSAGRRDLIEA